jgi:hypothetical protein
MVPRRAAGPERKVLSSEVDETSCFLSRGSRTHRPGIAPVTGRESPSWGCQVLQSPEPATLAPAWVRCSLRALGSAELGCKVFTPRASRRRERVTHTGNPLVDFQLPFRDIAKPQADPIERSRRSSAHMHQPGAGHGSPLMRFGPLQRLPSAGQRLQSAGLPRPDRLRLQVFTTS